MDRKYLIPAPTSDGFNYADVPNDSHLASANVRFGDRAGHGDCTGGFRFLPTVPKTLTIISAKLHMKSFTEALVGTMRVEIAADNVDNSPVFDDAAAEPRDRVLTTARVSWVEAAWLADTWKWSPEIKAVIQEIYDRGGFVAGNGLSIIISNDGSDAGANGSARSQDSGSDEAELWIWTKETETNEIYATRMPTQKACFHANGRFWMFYDQEDQLFYRTSTDGVNWAIEVNLGLADAGANFSVWFDGTYIHYVRQKPSLWDFYYRRGTPNADGSITWSAAEQLVGVSGADPTIIVDSAGYPWIFYLVTGNGTFTPWVTKSDTNDGTWSTEAGFPFHLSADSSLYMRCFGVPLTGGKVFAMWGWANAQAKGRCWTGAAWDAEETITVSNLRNYPNLGPGMSAVNEGDDVHLVFWDTTPDILYRKRTYGVGWAAEQTVQAGVTATSEPALSISSSTLYCFWAGSPAADHIYYKMKVGAGAWSVIVDWIDETTDDLTAYTALTCSYMDYGNYILLEYMALTASPYHVRMNNISLAGGWTGKISGVTNPAAIMGVPIANIAKVKGVA